MSVGWKAYKTHKLFVIFTGLHFGLFQKASPPPPLYRLIFRLVSNLFHRLFSNTSCSMGTYVSYENVVEYYVKLCVERFTFYCKLFFSPFLPLFHEPLCCVFPLAFEKTFIYRKFSNWLWILRWEKKVKSPPPSFAIGDRSYSIEFQFSTESNSIVTEEKILQMISLRERSGNSFLNKWIHSLPTRISFISWILKWGTNSAVSSKWTKLSWNYIRRFLQLHKSLILKAEIEDSIANTCYRSLACFVSDLIS